MCVFYLVTARMEQLWTIRCEWVKHTKDKVKKYVGMFSFTLYIDNS